jgi:hypothetical protein
MFVMLSGEDQFPMRSVRIGNRRRSKPVKGLNHPTRLIKFQVLKHDRSMGEINGTELGRLPKQTHNSLKSTHESATIPFK